MRDTDQTISLDPRPDAKRWAEPWVNDLCIGLDNLVRNGDGDGLEILRWCVADAIRELQRKTFH